MSGHAQEVQGVGMSRVDANDLAIKGLGLLDFARFVMLDRAMQRLRDRSHRIPFRHEELSSVQPTAEMRRPPDPQCAP